MFPLSQEADSHQNAEHHNGHHLAVGPVRSQILREQADDRIHKGGHFLGGVIGGQFILHPAANVSSHTGNQGDQAGNEGVQHQKEHGFETDLLQADGIAQIGDAGNETPGLGMKAEEADFYKQFENKKVDKFDVVKTTPSKDDEIEAITGSTITSKAMANGCNAAITYFQNKLQGGAN